MKSFKELREGAENYTVKKGPYTRKVDGKTADKMKRQGWKLVAREEVEESVDLEEGKMKEFHDYIDQGKSAQWIAKKMSLDMKTVKELMADIKESVELSEATVSRSDFEKLKKGMRIEIDFGSSISSSQKRVFTVKSTSRSAKYKVDKINMTIDGKGKYHLYSRDGKDATLALGNMAATIKSYKILGINESVELSEAPDLEKMSNELLKHKSKGVDYEKAAAYVRAMYMNSALSVQDKAMKGLLTLLKNMDLKDRTTITKILKDNGFKVKGGQLMRESVELDEKTTIDLAREVVKKKSAKYGLDMQTANLIIQVYDKVNDVNKKKMEKMNPSALGQAVWKMTGK